MKSKCFLIMGLLCIFYYLGSGMHAGFHVQFLNFWLFMGIILCLVGLIKPLWKSKWITRLIVIGSIFYLVSAAVVLRGSSSQGKQGLDYIVVLGAAVRGTGPSYVLEMRILTAYDYLVNNPDTMVIASGGKGSGQQVSEAECIANLLIEKGIEPERILLEEQSATTVENLSYAYEMIADKNSSIGVVTSDFHVARACFIARNQGFLEVSGIAAPYSKIMLPHYILREAAVFIVDMAQGRISLWG